jgi:hypothetical protein
MERLQANCLSRPENTQSNETGQPPLAAATLRANSLKDASRMKSNHMSYRFLKINSCPLTANDYSRAAEISRQFMSARLILPNILKKLERKPVTVIAENLDCYVKRS